MLLRQTVLALFTCFLFAASVSANLCSEIRSGSAPTDKDSSVEADLHEALFPVTDLIGSRGWNRKILVCNRKRDTKGNEILKIMTNPDYRSERDVLFESDLDAVLINGKYNFFGDIVTQQKYSYILSKSNGVWTMTIPYDASINDTVHNRVDIYMGGLSTAYPEYSSSDMENHAWHLFEFSQLTFTGAGDNAVWFLKPDAKPIAETHCSDTTYYKGKENKYDGQHGANSNKRDRSNKHISLGIIEYSYGGNSWNTGCRVSQLLQVAWRPDPDSNRVLPPSSTKTWVFDNFIRTSEEYWSQPGNFKLRLLLKGVNEDEFSPSILNLLNNNDYLKVRFGTKFMPYGGNQVYKTSLIQFNNFSTMTTDETYWHEVGHALGLDDEYGGEDSGGAYKKNGCEHGDYRAFDPRNYQMCSSGADEVRSIYHYIATSRYVLTRICSEDEDCNKGEYCNIRLGLNRCLVDGTSKIGELCSKNKECESGKCQGNGSERMCVCGNDSDCNSGICIKGPAGIGKNFCRSTTRTECPSGWSYEVRNPLNKDRCNRTVTETEPLKCKLGALDKAKNWTGPHAQAGADECRSLKGKSPKGVKCPSGFNHTIRSGADTCTKNVIEHLTPTCAIGWDYKSQTGRDICQDK